MAFLDHLVVKRVEDIGLLRRISFTTACVLTRLLSPLDFLDFPVTSSNPFYRLAHPLVPVCGVQCY
jgi:hypothetical protein